MDISEKVKLIESMELDIGEKKNLILIVAGHKPACELPIRYCSMDDFDRETNTFKLPSSHYQSIIEGIDSIGIKHAEAGKGIVTIKTSKVYPGYAPVNIENKSLCVGEEAELLKELSLQKPRIASQEDVLYGNLMGYPETAIQAFAYNKKDLLDTGMTLFENPMDRSLDVDRFRSFTRTNMFYQQELNEVKKWHDTVKELSPKIYEKVIRFHENVAKQEPTKEMIKFLYTSSD